MRGAAIVAALVVAMSGGACGLRALRLGGVRRFHDSTEPGIARTAVRIVDRVPDGAKLVASIYGVRVSADHTAEDDGREIASRMGCDVLVVTGRGYEMRNNGTANVETPTIDFDAYRSARR